MSAARNLPRIIRPELIEVGDKIRVIFPERRGMRLMHEGIVSKRVDHGATRFLYTNDGATLVAWEPGVRNLSIMLLDRPPVKQTAMFDMEEFVRNA